MITVSKMLALLSQTIVSSLKGGIFQAPPTKARGNFRGHLFAYGIITHSVTSGDK